MRKSNYQAGAIYAEPTFMLSSYSNQQQHLLWDGVIEIASQILSNTHFSLSSQMAFSILYIEEHGGWGELTHFTFIFTFSETLHTRSAEVGSGENKQQSEARCCGDSGGILPTKNE